MRQFNEGQIFQSQIHQIPTFLFVLFSIKKLPSLILDVILLQNITTIANVRFALYLHMLVGHVL